MYSYVIYLFKNLIKINIKSFPVIFLFMNIINIQLNKKEK
jgi:hypothetical protein